MKMDLESKKGGLYVLWLSIAIMLIGLMFFCYGYYWIYSDSYHTVLWITLCLSIGPLIPVLLYRQLWVKKNKWYPPLLRSLEKHTEFIDNLPDKNIGLWIALAAGLGLYLELMVIRMHSSCFQLFAYFKNVSMFSCFMGLGIGYARGSKKPLATPLVLPFLAIQIILMYILRYNMELVKHLQNPITEQVGFGLEQVNAISHILLVYGFLVFIFTFNALCFIPLGHLASRLMNRKSKLVAYSWNLVGSLAGIFVFSLISFLWAPPAVWVLLGTIGLFLFLRKNVKDLVPTAISALVLISVFTIHFRLNEIDIYSPYQILTLTMQDEYPVLQVNNIYYQKILDLKADGANKTQQMKNWASHYALPYFFKSNPKDVLVVGSGTGNDVASAVRHGAGEIDAVEIDPAIMRLGKMLHPESPYSMANVHPIVNDARAYIRHTDKKYDLIVYGLLDSHTLLASMSGVRLDSYVYTKEAFQEAQARLKDDGIICLSFGVIKPELGHKLYMMLRDAFNGQKPIVYQTTYDGACSFIIGNHFIPMAGQQPFGTQDLSAYYGSNSIVAEESTDDWPFLYMPVRKYPTSYVLMILVLLIISMLFIRILMPGGGQGFSIPCYFLGAGFMLVETKGITELALAYGSTWFVISVVITGILIMAFLANLLIIRIPKPPVFLTYGLLIASLLFGYYLSLQDFNNAPAWMNKTFMTVILTLPLFFSGLAFSVELQKAVSIEVALSSNMLGAMLGGFLEYNSMYFGFRFLYILALVMYLLALVGSFQKPKTAKL